MKLGKLLLNLIFIAIGLGLILGGAYLGLWIMLIGGIVKAIEIFQSGAVVPMDVALTAVRIFFFAMPVGIGWWLGFIVLALTGTVNAHDRRMKKFNKQFGKQLKR